MECINGQVGANEFDIVSRTNSMLMRLAISIALIIGGIVVADDLYDKQVVNGPLKNLIVTLGPYKFQPSETNPFDFTRALLAQFPGIAAKESPITCRVEQGNGIECTVRVDRAEVTNMTINRGNCSTWIFFSQPSGISSTCQKRLDQICVANRLSHYHAKFGDVFGVVPWPQNCRVIEYSITVNGTDWRWSVP